MLLAFALLVLALPLSSAQVAAKKDAAKDAEEKKDAEKKDAAKTKEDGKDEPKKKDEDTKKNPSTKTKAPEEPKLVHGPVLQTVKLKAVDSAESRYFTVEMMTPDPMKIFQVQQWQMQRMAQIQQQGNPAQYQFQMAQFQVELAQRSANIYSATDVRLQAGDGCKVRTFVLPTEYDEKGNLKKWTPKEIAALKGNSKLPGYPAEFDALRQGQYLNVYLSAPKVAPKGSGPLPKKKAPTDEDLAVMADARPDCVMIVIVADPGAMNR